MEINLVMETIKFLILGMSTVFMFLILMVFVMEIQAKIIMKFFPHKEEKVLLRKVVSKQDNLAVVAAIAASLKIYKK